MRGSPMNELIIECLDDLEAALEWLELPGQSRPGKAEIDKCRQNVAQLRRALASARGREEQTPLKWLDLPTGVSNALLRAGYSTIEELEKLTPSQLASVPRIGGMSVKLVASALKTWKSRSLG